MLIMRHKKRTCGALVGLLWPACDVTVVWGCTLAKSIEILGRKLHVLRAEPAGCPAGYPSARVVIPGDTHPEEVTF